MKLDLIERTDNLCIAIGGLVLDNLPAAIGGVIITAAIGYDIHNSTHTTERPVERIELPIPEKKSHKEELISLINSIFNSYGLPDGIGATIAMYESRLNPLAVSKTGCAGLMQFCKGTAKAYGLEDRFNPIASTIAAAELMVDNKRYLEKKGIDTAPLNLYLSHMIGNGGTVLLHKVMRGRNLSKRDNKTLLRVLKPNWYSKMGKLSNRVSKDNVVRFYNHVNKNFNKISKEINNG